MHKHQTTQLSKAKQTGTKTHHLESPLLAEIDPYTLLSFQELQSYSFLNNSNSYITKVSQNNREYHFFASKFIEECLRSGRLRNPFTRQPISNFQIIVSSQERPSYRTLMSKEVLTKPNYYPILFNDFTRSKEDRIALMLDYGRMLESTHPGCSVQAYHRAIGLGSQVGRLYLGSLYHNLGYGDLAVRLLEECVEMPEITTENLFFCAGVFERNRKERLAFKTHLLIAKRGNAYGIGEVIQRLELGIGTKKSLELACEWRSKLADGWRESSICDLFSHLEEIGYDYSRTGYP